MTKLLTQKEAEALQPNCQQRWKGHKVSRIEDIQDFFIRMQSDDDDTREAAFEEFNEYGLSFDYVAPETFKDQKEGYWRYQISYGGPSEEFRFYAGGSGEQKPYRISFVFLDWFDGYEESLIGSDLETMHRIWSDFADCEMTTYAYERGTEGWSPI